MEQTDIHISEGTKSKNESEETTPSTLKPNIKFSLKITSRDIFEIFP